MKTATIITWLLNHKRFVFEAILSLLTALSISCGIVVYNKNKILSEGLKMAQNNVEAYQGLLSDSQQANRVLQLTVEDLQQSKDKQIQNLVSTAKDNNIKTKHISTAATQKQTLSVTGSNKIDTIYKYNNIVDSIVYNRYTKLYYNIYKDTIHTQLDISNTQQLLVYTKKQYKNKKSFIKRLFTLDFKKITTTEYKIVNSNDLIQQDSVRVIQIK